MTDIVYSYLQSRGFRTPDAEWRSRLSEWRAWYGGCVDAFHRYSVWNGIQRVGQVRAGLCMAKTVCEDWANLLLNERVRISAAGAQERIDALLAENRFETECARLIEQAFALGTGAFSEYLDGDGRPRIDYHDAEHIVPISWHGHDIRECAFFSTEFVGGAERIYIRMYLKDPDGTCRIENVWLDAENGRRVANPDGIAGVIRTGQRVPLFQIVTPNVVGNFSTRTPMGISVFAHAISALKGIDVAYDSFVNEFLLGRKRLLIPASMARIQLTKDGEIQPLFDPTDTTFVAYTPAEDQAEGFHDLSPAIRADEHLTGLRTCLNVLSFKCGLGTGRYDFDRASGVRTATEVISEQSDLYQSKVKHEHILREALTGLVRALLVLDGGDADTEIRICFDDSIIQDLSAQHAEARAEVAAGLMSRFRYLTEHKGMTQEAAEAELQRIEAENNE